MRTKAFVPGHISCIFRPVRTDDVSTTGSMGFGIRLNLGCTATVWQRDDDQVNIFINGKRAEAPLTRSAIQSMAPGKGFDVRLKHDLPLGQGFGTSASGTYASTVCVAELLGLDQKEAAIATHKTECTMGGGLGDLLAMSSEYGVPIRESPGISGITGKTSDSGLFFDNLTLIVFDEPLSTASVLSDEGMMSKIIAEGDRSMEMFRSENTIDGFFKAANTFSERTGLESEKIRRVLESIRKEGYQAGMCMLGNSIYTTAPAEKMRELFPNDTVVSASSYSGPIILMRC